jgi:branched-chain amino acid transport system substrate-binding protein
MPATCFAFGEHSPIIESEWREGDEREERMGDAPTKVRMLMSGRLVAVVLLALLPLGGTGVRAEEAPAPIKIGAALDLSSPFGRFVARYSEGQRDYVALVNGRGGIKGHPLELFVHDQGGDLKRGLEAYQTMKGEGVIAVDFLNTAISRAVVPEALANGMNVITLFHGRADAADGRVFPTIFPLTATFWSQAADIVKFIEDQEKEEIDGKRIALVAIDTALGHEVEPVLSELAQRLRFKFKAFYYPAPGTDQAAAWKGARSFGPQWTLIWAAGAAQGESVRQALQNGFKLDHVAANVALTEDDLVGIDPGKVAGLLRFEGVASGRDLPIIKAILDEVVAQGRGAGKAEDVGHGIYNAGVASMVFVGEAARLALASEGEPLTPEKLKKGFEQLHDFTADDLVAPTTINARDHQGGGRGRIAQWDGQKWVERRRWFAAYQDIVWNLILKDSATFKQTGK